MKIFFYEKFKNSVYLGNERVPSSEQHAKSKVELFRARKSEESFRFSKTATLFIVEYLWVTITLVSETADIKSNTSACYFHF